MIITPEETCHGAAIERLLDVTFGIDRHQKSSYRLREGVAPVAELCLVALDHDDYGDERILGTIRFWEVMAGGVPSLLLGPIAVDPGLQGAGLGSKLIRLSLNKAAAAGYRSVLLVGDAPYYERFGFSRLHTLRLAMPGPTDPARFLGLELMPGALRDAMGMVAPMPVDGFAAISPMAELVGEAPMEMVGGGIWYAAARPN